MSRSYRHSPFSGNTTARSERADKMIWHGRFRALTRTAMTSAPDLAQALLPLPVEAASPCDLAKDGKHFVSPASIRRQLQHIGRRYVMKHYGKRLVNQAERHQGSRHA